MLAAGGRRLLRSTYSGTAAFDVLQTLHLIKDDGPVSSVLCDACQDPHAAPVTYDQGEDRYGWTCYDQGFVPAEIDDVAAVSVSIDNLLRRLRSALSCTSGDAKQDNETLKRVGTITIGDEAVTVHLATRSLVGEAIHRVRSAFASAARSDHLLLLVPGFDPASGVVIPGTVIAPLEDVIRLDPQLGLTANQAAIARLAGVNMKPGAGHPSVYGEMLKMLVEERDRKGIAEETIGREATAIQTVWNDRWWGVNIPSSSTVKCKKRTYREGS